MKRVIKKKDSEILTQGLNYIVNGNNTNLRDVLFAEQKGFCVYTETFLGRTDKKEIDHFNPTLKGKTTDSYDNWFLIKAQWNLEKSSKWAKYQPVLHPTAQDFEDRIIYFEGDYLLANSNDIEAKNLITLLKLDDADFAKVRKNYIIRISKEINDYGSALDYFKELIDNELFDFIRFIRALENEFKVDIYSLIP